MARLALFDAHCHLQDARIAKCAPQLIQQASDAGVRWFAVNGTSEEDWGAVKKMGESYMSVIPNFGLHPWYIPKRSENWLSTLRAMLIDVPTAGLGEVGLDLGTHGREIDEALQVDILREQLNLGRELQRPISIHCVRAVGPLQGLLSKMGTFPAGLIMHSFTGPAESVRGLLRNGAYFSFSGFLTPVKASKAKNILAQVPLDRILLETDAPDALPKVDLQSLVWVPDDATAPAASHENGENGRQACCSDENQKEFQTIHLPAKGVLNHPANIQANLAYIATLLGISVEELAAQSTQNAEKIFSFPGSKLVI